MWYMIVQHWWLLVIALLVGVALGWWFCRKQEA